MAKSTISSASASDYYSTKDEVKRNKGKQGDPSVTSTFYTDNNCAPNTGRHKRTLYKVNYQEDDVDGEPEEPVSRLEKYRRELARTRK
ncbi:hypothetical protein Btru_036962, partial [Bulinus truncatus]